MTRRNHFKYRPTRRSLLRAGAALGIGAPLLSACASRPVHRIPAPTGFIPEPKPRSGERWRYALINRYSGETINEITATVSQVYPETTIELVDQNGKKLASERYDSPWQIRQEPIYNETLVFDHPLPLIPGKLAVGAQETHETQFRLPGSDNPHPWIVSLSVDGWERLKVPAGIFDTVRIDRRISFESPDLFRRGSRRIDTLWYAPAVNRWVQREWTGFYFEDGPDPFGFFDRHGPYGHSYFLRRDQSFLLGFGPDHLQEEREDSISWVLLEHQAAPVAS
jgi:hypothetical protein